MDLKETLFPNEKKNTKAPDYSSNFDHNGLKHQIAGWVREPYKGKPGYIWITVKLHYKEEGKGDILELNFSAERNSRSAPASREPLYKTKIAHDGENLDVAVWDNEAGRLKVTIKSIGESNKSLAPVKAPALEEDSDEGDYSSDDLPF